MTARTRAGRTRCTVPGCGWWMPSDSQAERDRAWATHWRTTHANPTSHTTRCRVTPCTWTTTSPDIDELRRLAREHADTHPTSTRPA